MDEAVARIVRALRAQGRLDDTVIVFSREDYASGRTRLFTIDVTGYNERELPTPLDASDPDWSNAIP